MTTRTRFARWSGVTALSAGLALAVGGCDDTETTPGVDAAADVATDAARADASADAAAPLYLLTVQGTLRASAPDAGADDAGAGDGGTFNTDFARGAHNAVVGGFMTTAMAAGDLTHHVGLGQSDPSQFLAFDTWNNLQGLTGTLSNPQFLSAFGAIFAGTPTTNVWVPAEGYTRYALPATGATRIYVLIRATLRTPADAARTAHNAVVSGSMSQAVMAGDVSHTAWISQGDPTQFLGVDVWTNAAGFMAFVSNPQVAAALGSVFASPPTFTTFTPPPSWTTYGSDPAWGTP